MGILKRESGWCWCLVVLPLFLAFRKRQVILVGTSSLKCSSLTNIVSLQNKYSLGVRPTCTFEVLSLTSSPRLCPWHQTGWLILGCHGLCHTVSTVTLEYMDDMDDMDGGSTSMQHMELDKDNPVQLCWHS